MIKNINIIKFLLLLTLIMIHILSIQESVSARNKDLTALFNKVNETLFDHSGSLSSITYEAIEYSVELIEKWPKSNEASIVIYTFDRETLFKGLDDCTYDIITHLNIPKITSYKVLDNIIDKTLHEPNPNVPRKIIIIKIFEKFFGWQDKFWRRFTKNYRDQNIKTTQEVENAKRFERFQEFYENSDNNNYCINNLKSIKDNDKNINNRILALLALIRFRLMDDPDNYWYSYCVINDDIYAQEFISKYPKHPLTPIVKLDIAFYYILKGKPFKGIYELNKIYKNPLKINSPNIEVKFYINCDKCLRLGCEKIAIYIVKLLKENYQDLIYKSNQLHYIFAKAIYKIFYRKIYN